MKFNTSIHDRLNLQLTTCYLLLSTTYCLLPSTYYFPPNTYHLPPTTYYHYLQPTTATTTTTTLRRPVNARTLQGWSFLRGHRQSADMHFTWPAWDKSQSRLALFVKCVCVASVSVFCGKSWEPLPRYKKCVFVWENAGCKFQKSARRKCSHAFYVACVGQNPVSVSSVRTSFA